jgi:hypothetical protein
MTRPDGSDRLERRLVRVGDSDKGGFVSRRVAGETVIVPISGRAGDLEAIYTLNDVASRIWQALEHPMTVGQIVDLAAAEYEVVRDEAERDVLGFLEHLEARGLIEAG